MTLYQLSVTLDCSTPVRVGNCRNKFPPSPNARLHWAQRAKLSKIWRARAYLAIGSDRPREPLMKCFVMFTKVAPRDSDHDNFQASLKPVIDGLKDAGIMFDDSREYFKSDNQFEKCKRGHEKLVIEIKEIA